MSDFNKGTREIWTYLRRTYSVAAPFWRSKHWKIAWTLLLGALAILALRTYLMQKASFVGADLIDSMDARELGQLWRLVGSLTVVWTILLATSVLDVHVENLLIIHWRRFMTRRYLGQYLDDDLYNQLEIGDYDLDNPDQRIAMDLFNAAKETLSLFMSITRSASIVGVYSVILWQVSGALEFEAAGYDIVIPGYMFWIAISYAVATTWLTHRLAAPMTRLNFERQAAEADFRYELVRLRENSESVALLNGKQREMSTLLGKFGVIWNNWMLLLKYKKRVIGMQFGQFQLGMFLPYVVAMPALFAGTVRIGGVVQLGTAFTSVVAQLSFFVANYDKLAEWKSSIDRITTLEDAFRKAQSERKQCRIEWSSGEQQSFEINGLDVKLPTGDRLLDDLRFSLPVGKNVLVTGASGSGKSTFFKAMSKLWIWGDGEIRRPEGTAMFIPQKAYLPIDSLRNVLTYPNPPDAAGDARLRKVMRLCLLDKFVERLDEECDWSRVLSGGEQQRLSFVRAIVAEPDWLFLDEATAAMDPATEATVYSALETELPNTTLISITHRESLHRYHDLQLHIDPDTRSMLLLELQPA